MNTQRPSDSAYKFLFSNKRIFHQLLTSFVPEEFVEDLSPEDLFPVDKSFVSEEFITRESDLIYRVKRGEREVYVYILLEFQSTPDKTIAALLLSYIMRLYETFLKTSKAGKLPAVFPMVLYNGLEEWKVPENIANLIEHTISDDYIPHFRYFKIIERDIAEDTLFELNNLVAAVIYLEKQRDAKKLKHAIENVVEMIAREDILDVKQFAVWAKRMLTVPDTEDLIQEIQTITEVESMLTHIADQIREEGIAEGIAEGENAKAISTAKRMVEEGLDTEMIVRVTGLSRETVKTLRRE
jgi:predicted transposase/invertase (TIGR01784 family)